MQKSSNIMKYVFIALAGVAFVAGFLFKDGRIGQRPAPKQDTPLITLDQYIKPIDPGMIGYEEVDRIKIDLKNPAALAVSRENNLYVAGDAQLYIFKDLGQEFSRIVLEKPVTAMAVAPDGHLFVALKDHIRMHDKQGKLLGIWEKINGAVHITSIAATEAAVFAADAANKMIWRYNHDGTLLGRIGERNVKQGKLGFIIPGPFFDIAIGYEGMLWAVNPGRLALENYTLDGKLRSSWGKISVDIDGFCGCCNPTHLTILPDGAFVTGEKGIPRVKVHEPSGELRTVVAGPKQFAEAIVIADLAVDAQERILVLDSAERAVRIFAKKQEE